MLRRLIILAAISLLVAAAAPPANVPIPTAKPDTAQETPAPATPPKNDADTLPKTETKPVEQPPPVEKIVVEEKPEALKACLAALKEIGAEFRTIDPIEDANGCGIEAPVELNSVLSGIKFEPAGTMRCETALALARWTKDMVVPAARISMPERQITVIANASAYVCRKRNGASTGKISEHAKGNAADIASISFSQGEPLIMKPRTDDATLAGAFQRTITASACLYFTTVLSPGSDAAHQDHLHLDVIDRKGGYRYCR
jgi:hypothetical protein